MFFWFIAVAVCIVLFVFDSPAFDYRFVAAGAVLPLAEFFLVGSRLLHTLAGSVLLLAAVMAATLGRRLWRRRLLGLPIGTLVFLAAGGVWTHDTLFWWPLLGADGGLGAGGPFFGSSGGGLGDLLPEFNRPFWLLAVMELVGIAVLAWLWQRFELDRPEHRQALLKQGRLPRDRMPLRAPRARRGE